ncbi:MAG TPA: glucose-6-phosphate isomerase [Dermatophilaceae bacterium]|nr:glucose-6-phosphate isomerase [Dermatophilaceae bacterium]
MSTVGLGVLATGAAADAVATHVPELVSAGFASKLFAQDPTLWGPAAEAESAVRLSWVGLARSSRPLLGEISALRADLHQHGLDHIVLCGMGGSSLAPEVICGTAGADLTVLDSSDPDSVRAALRNRLEHTVVVVSSKSGSTVETDSQRRAYEAAFRDAGIDPAARIVIVTDPGSPLDKDARDAGYRVINADPNVGGRYSALTAFGLVPSGLAGADIERLLDEAESVTDLLAADDEANPGLRLGAAMGGTQPLRDKLVIVDHGSGLVGFADWAEQLIAESTGKDGTGILPVVVQDDDDPEVATPAPDVTVARLVGEAAEATQATQATRGTDVTDGRSEVHVSGSLGAQLLLWEVATAVAGRLLGISPFDQPDVESAKKAARGLLEASGGAGDAPAFTDRAIEVRSLGPDFLGPSSTVREALDALYAQLDPQRGYVAVMAYLDRIGDGLLEQCRRVVARHTGRPTTFGWGPRFLHSTGQYHKGGPDTGVYVQVTTAPRQDLAIPGREFSFGTFIKAQAGGDAQVLAAKGRPVLQLHLTDHDTGLAQLMDALGVPVDAYELDPAGDA